MNLSPSNRAAASVAEIVSLCKHHRIPRVETLAFVAIALRFQQMTQYRRTHKLQGTANWKAGLCPNPFWWDNKIEAAAQRGLANLTERWIREWDCPKLDSHWLQEARQTLDKLQ